MAFGDYGGDTDNTPLYGTDPDQLRKKLFPGLSMQPTPQPQPWLPTMLPPQPAAAQPPATPQVSPVPRAAVTPIPPPSPTSPPQPNPLAGVVPQAAAAPNLQQDTLSGAAARPVAANYQPAKQPAWKTALGAISAGAVGFRDPQAGVEVGRHLAEAPRVQAQQAFQNDENTFDKAASQGLATRQANREEANTQSEIKARDAATAQLGQPKPKEEEWSIVPGIQGPNGEAVQQEKNSGQVRVAPLPGATLKDAKGPNTKEQLQSQIATEMAKPQPDQKVIQNLQGRLKAIDPLAEDRLKDSENRAATAGGDKGTVRSDKSYQYNQSKLDKVRTPVDQLAGRFSRLTDTLNQKSPQADALVAPELLSVMAGGVGSGVRMNEAEISRIVGGRSQWESLKASINKWNTDPEAARSITADQDSQIRNLIQAVGQKVTAKQSVLEEAQNRLLETDDVKEHRKIVAEAQKKLDDIDAGSSKGNAESAGPPAGATMKVPGSDGKMHWSDGKADLGVANE